MNVLNNFKQVCRLWRDLIESTSKWKDTFLLNSWTAPLASYPAGIPLHISWCISPPPAKGEKEPYFSQAESLISLLCSPVHPIKSLYLSFFLSAQDVITQKNFSSVRYALNLGINISTITHLQLQNLPYSSVPPPLQLFTRLHTLEVLNGQIPPTTSGKTTPVKHVYVHLPTHHHRVDWVDFFESAMELETFCLESRYNLPHGCQDIVGEIGKWSPHVTSISVFLQDGEWAVLAGHLLVLFKKSLKMVGLQMGMPRKHLASRMLGEVMSKISQCEVLEHIHMHGFGETDWNRILDTSAPPPPTLTSLIISQFPNFNGQHELSRWLEPVRAQVKVLVNGIELSGQNGVYYYLGKGDVRVVMKASQEYHGLCPMGPFGDEVGHHGFSKVDIKGTVEVWKPEKDWTTSVNHRSDDPGEVYWEPEDDDWEESCPNIRMLD
ncbi:hypothetical protein BS47DRAFT_1366302 [Hydnum rufescens UP504]|uniref:F-box domain-containing protein n=1 Tax=Hydnum rufescens UP504 TaxID=1448309 RepID=A0A9P6ALC7_9AGAM|nr:hypothetical protein BS47DRAFT_1366302 [Hydnum rufescens UP504]